jgi:hypothetical protein
MKQKQKFRQSSKKQIEKFLRKLERNYKAKMKNFQTITGSIGRGVGC